jgi:internalin A
LSTVENLEHLESLEITGRALSDKDIEGIATIVGLQELYLSSSELVGDITKLSSLENLTVLDLSGSHQKRVDDGHNPVYFVGSDVKKLHQLISKLTSLEKLNLRGTRFSDVSILAKLPKLKFLDIRGTRAVNEIIPEREGLKIVRD